MTALPPLDGTLLPLTLSSAAAPTATAGPHDSHHHGSGVAAVAPAAVGAATAVGTESSEQELAMDPMLLRELNEHALSIAEKLAHVMGGLQAQVHAIGNITLRSAEAYGLAVDNVNKAVGKSVDDTVALINKTDELNAEMAPIYAIASQIKDIKKTLDVLENMCK